MTRLAFVFFKSKPGQPSLSASPQNGQKSNHSSGQAISEAINMKNLTVLVTLLSSLLLFTPVTFAAQEEQKIVVPSQIRGLNPSRKFINAKCFQTL